MKTIFTSLFTLCLAVFALAQAPSLPIDFESDMITYTFNDFEGGVGSVIDNPDASGINTSAKVGQMVKFDGATFGGSTLPLAGNIDFGTNNAIKMKVWANRVGAPITFKLEGMAPTEVVASTTVANAWEELTFSFAGLTGADYNAITIIYDNGTVGDGSADFTLYFDDMELTTAMGSGVNLPIDFESDMLTYTFNDFEGGVGSVIDNPDASGINTSAKVGQMVKFDGATFGGSTIPLDGAIDFGDNNAIKMKVWANRVGAPITFKLEGPAPTEVVESTTTASQWEELTFSFSGLTGGTYTGITIIYDNGTVGDGGVDFTLYFDDIELTTAMGNGVNLPIDFESDMLTYTFNDFEGGVGSVIDNPDASGINTSAKVGQMVKFDGATFGGSTLALDGAIDFGSNNAIKMKVWANRVGAPITFKLEGPAPTEVVESTTVANQWEELTFSFSGLTGGTYTAITIIYDNGTVGDGSADFTFYFDDIELTTVTPMGVQIPVTFESTTLNYSFADFEGGAASVIDNPDASGINMSSKVGQMIKFEGADFAGSTLALGIPFTFGDNTSLSMKVWANRTGAPVLLKLEGSPNPVEVNMMTTVANQWEELTFDFTGMNGGTYTGITIIYDLGTVGDGSADFTLYFDDIQVPGTLSTFELSELGVKYFPNPVVDFMTLQAPEDIDAIRIFNLNGQQVYFERTNNNQSEIDLSTLGTGTYFMQVKIGDKLGAATFVKQ